MNIIKDFDRELYDAILKEERRQLNNIELIASENYVSDAVREAYSTVLTNKYAEGYPGRRYYGGCEHVDIVENLAIDRAKKMFNANYVNVQPHSGSQANFAALMALCNPGDTVLGMDLSHGGHLTHGSPVNFSGKLFNFVGYTVSPKTFLIDYDNALAMAKKHRPKVIIAGASAYSRSIDFARFRAIADEVGAFLMADIAHIAGLVVAGLHNSPLPHAHLVTTTTHKTLRGPRGGLMLSDNEEIAKKMNSSIFPGSQGGPLLHVIGAKALAFKEALDPSFKAYQERVIANAQSLSNNLVGHGFDVLSGGTDNHLLLIDLRSKGITGKDMEHLLDRVSITANKNSVPFDTSSPTITAGIRFGSPAMTSRGFGTLDMAKVGDFINKAYEQRESGTAIEAINKDVQEFASSFPTFKY